VEEDAAMASGGSVANRLFIWLVLAGVAAVAVLIFVMRSSLNHRAPQADPAGAENLTVSIDNQTFALRDGFAELPAAPGSATGNTLRVVGEPVTADVNADGKPDAALLLQNDPGGSGIFYYAVLAINDGAGYHASNVLPLGDRIKPQGIGVADGRFVYRFLDRTPEEPMAAEPTVEKKVVVEFDPATGRISTVS
jgi:hypothetical protein